MKYSWKCVSGLALIAVIAFGMIAPGLQAGPALAASFKLPFDAKLGKIALPTGDYFLSLDHAAFNGLIRFYQGNQVVGIVRAQAFDDRQGQSKNPVLICIRHDGNVTVRALRLPSVGTFYFSLPKELAGLMARQPKLVETVSVEVRGE
jgi:hypothetical protein